MTQTRRFHFAIVITGGVLDELYQVVEPYPWTPVANDINSGNDNDLYHLTIDVRTDGDQLIIDTFDYNHIPEDE